MVYFARKLEGAPYLKKMILLTRIGSKSILTWIVLPNYCGVLACEFALITLLYFIKLGVKFNYLFSFSFNIFKYLPFINFRVFYNIGCS